MLVRFYCPDSGQTVAINPDHIIKVSTKSSKDRTEKWCSYINTVNNGTLRVLDSFEEAVSKIEACYCD